MTTNQTIHATCVAWEQRAVLIQGTSGRGKSALGLTLMGMGCVLVADDRVALRAEDNRLIATCPASIRGLIEARGVGILKAAFLDSAEVVLAVDLDQTETERMPQRRIVTHLKTDIALIHPPEGPHFAASILQILKSGWSER